MNATTMERDERLAFEAYDGIATTNREIADLSRMVREFLSLAQEADGAYLKESAPGLAMVVNTIVQKTKTIDTRVKELLAATKGGPR